MDATVINGLITTLCTTVGSAAIVGAVTLWNKRLDIRHENRKQEHTETKDAETSQKELAGGYRQMWQDVSNELKEAEKRAEEAERLLRLMRSNCRRNCDVEKPEPKP